MRKLIRFTRAVIKSMILIIVIIIFLDMMPFTIFKSNKENVFRSQTEFPLIIPHGGAKDLAPENTIYAFDMLVNEFYADVLEIDIALTKDNILIAHHNLILEFSENSTLNNSKIRDLTYREILAEYQQDDYFLAREFSYPDDYKNGEAPFKKEIDQDILKTLVPANLETDIFSKYGNSVLYILEIKDSPTSQDYEQGSNRFETAAQILIDMVYQFNLENNVVLASFSDEVTNYFKENAPDVLISAAQNEVTQFSLMSAFSLDFFWPVQNEVLIIPNQTSMGIIGESTSKILDKLPSFIRNKVSVKTEEGYKPFLTHKQLVDDAHRKNMSVIYWTINDPDEMRHLINIKADGIITDRPDLLIDIINESSQ